MAQFANLTLNKFTFYQWLNFEYGIVKREYKELADSKKVVLKEKYQEYLKEAGW